MKNLLLLSMIIVLVISTINCCNNNSTKKTTSKMSSISEETINKTINELVNKHGESYRLEIEKGVKQTAALWRQADGTDSVFYSFCIENYVSDKKQKKLLFDRISANLEILYGCFNKIQLELRRPLDLNLGEITKVDELFASYNPAAHMQDDFYANKIAFITMLNFPFYTLKEKHEYGKNWTREQWAYARLGDIFVSRVPAEIQQKATEIMTMADAYIADYNIYMGKIVNNENKKLFPPDMKLITHWGLRDELKSNYSDKTNGLEKQKIIYEIMKHIIYQDIPKEIINNPNYTWNPYKNIIYDENNKEIKHTPEPNTRYKHLLNNFIALKEMDPYNVAYPTFIERAFDANMEMTQQEVENLFIEFITSPLVKDVAQLISERLGRPLQPFDIWYDGFKARSNISEVELTKKTQSLYPNKETFEKSLSEILLKLGWTREKAEYITSKIAVDASRGAGHAWQAEMRGDKAHLRTRINNNGMDYKGYNIAIHEFGHNVEQTLSLYDVDYYMLRGVPNTAFTEALAFIFQKRDLELLGIKNDNPYKEYLLTLDNFWASYEIMGVALVDMYIWKWLYDNPNATEEQVKNQVIHFAKEVWNKYYAPIFGQKDEPILAIYSHMITSPLYLSAYPLGHIIDFQIEKYIKEKNFAEEINRIYSLGKLTPNEWMQKAVGMPVSVKPMLEATKEAIEKLRKNNVL